MQGTCARGPFLAIQRTETMHCSVSRIAVKWSRGPFLAIQRTETQNSQRPFFPPLDARGPFLAIQRTETEPFSARWRALQSLADPSSLFRGLKLTLVHPIRPSYVTSRGPFLAIQRTETPPLGGLLEELWPSRTLPRYSED